MFRTQQYYVVKSAVSVCESTRPQRGKDLKLAWDIDSPKRQLNPGKWRASPKSTWSTSITRASN